MSARFSRNDLLGLLIVMAALLIIYLPGLGNAPVADDGYLTDGELFADYRSVLEPRARMLSYGSFVLLRSLAGEGWWKQRVANLAIHAAVVLALWALYREVLRHVAAPPAPGREAGAPHSGDASPALAFAIGCFALNPVAVYAVAYLIQRSILLATLFVVLGLWAFALAVARRRPALHLAAVACYALAVMSKEHAVLAPLAAVPLYILIARPSGRRLALFAGGGILLVGLAAAALWARYGEILGKPFDEYSRVYLTQLAELDPEAPRRAFGLSILNQSYLFFEYGLRWFVPYAGWMSINLRPPFPLTWTTLPQALGIAGYATLVIGGFFLLLRYRDWRALAGFSILVPALLFATEFATVWVQDPFVLYRSYLWAIGVPGLIFCLVQGPPPRAFLLAGLAVGAIFAWQALDRVLSMATPERVYTDAIRKLPDDPRSVGRWFPYLNRGNAYFDRDMPALAMKDFESSAALGDMGMGMFNMGSMLSMTGRHQQALAAFERAEKQGYDLYNLPFQRGLSLMAIGKVSEAYDQFEAARKANPPSPTREALLLNLGRAAERLGKPEEAIRDLEPLLALTPGNGEATYLLALAYVMKGEPARALEVVDKLPAAEKSARAYYARALAYHGLKRKAEATADIDEAVRVAPGNANMREWQAKIRAMPQAAQR